MQQQTQLSAGSGAASTADQAVEMLPVPDKQIGTIIGAGGNRLAEVRAASGASVHIEPTNGTAIRQVTIWGRPQDVQMCVQMIKEIVAADEPPPSKALRPGTEQATVEVARQYVGIVIGKSGTNIRDLMIRSGCEIWVDTNEQVKGDNPNMRKVQIVGTPDQVAMARELLAYLLEQRHNSKTALATTPTEHSRAERQIFNAVAGGAMSAGPGTGTGAGAAPSASGGPQAMEEVHISDGALSALLEPANSSSLVHLQASGLQIHFAKTRSTRHDAAGDGDAAGGAPPAGSVGPSEGGAGTKRTRAEADATGGADGAHGSAAAELASDSGQHEHLNGGAATTDAGSVAAAAAAGVVANATGSGARMGGRIVRLYGDAAAIPGAKAVLAACEAHAAAARTHEALSALSAEEALFRYYQPLFGKAGLPYAPPAKLWVDEVTLDAMRYQRWASYYYASSGGQPPAAGVAPSAVPPELPAPSDLPLGAPTLAPPPLPSASFAATSD